MATIIGTDSNNILNGTASSDTIIGRAGHDQLFGNGGDDRLSGGNQNDLLNGGLGSDTADYSNLIIGGTTYIGATAGVRVNLNLAGAQDTGGAGIDTLVSIENLTGTTFNDILTGNGGNNVLSGLAGNDIVTGVAGNDQLLGGDGTDLLNGGVGNDTVNGGLGSDTADYGNFLIGGNIYIGATAGVRVNLNLAGAQNTGGAGIDTLVSIENLTGSIFNDILTGNGANNVLTGREGNDTLIGGLGNDLLQGDSGNDTLNGGDGIDTASYTTATAGVMATLDYDGSGQAMGGAGIDTLWNIENLTGSRFNDVLNSRFGTINGGDGDDRLSSAEGLATLNGGAGNDVLCAVEGNYTLNGGDGNDVVTFLGLAGNGMINGGAGADRLTHDAGAGGEPVTFDYNLVSDSPAGTGRDTIIIIGLFGEPATAGLPAGDQIDLRDIDANTLVTGNQAFTYIGSAAFSAAGQLRYAGGILSGSTDGDTAAEFEIQLVGSPALTVGGAGTDILL